MRPNIRGKRRSQRRRIGLRLEALEARALLTGVLSIEPAPVLTSEGLANPDLAPFTIVSTDPSASDFKAAIAWGDGTTSAGTIFAGGSLNNGTFGLSVHGNHTYTSTSPTTIQLTVTDASGKTTVATTPVTVLKGPIGGVGLKLQVLPDALIGQTIVGAPPIGVPIAEMLDEADPLPYDHKISIDWGDGTSDAAGIFADGPVTGADTFEIDSRYAHIYGSIGDYTVTITDTDKLGNVTTIATTAVVEPIFGLTGLSPAGGPGAVTGGSSAVFTATLTAGPTPDVAIDWGDGSAPSAASLSAGASSGAFGEASGQEFTATGTHTYAQPGIYSAHVVALDPASGFSTSSETTITVGRSMVSVQATPLSVLVGNPVAIQAADGSAQPVTGLPIASFEDSGSVSVAGLSAAIDWGDGSPLQGGIVSKTGPDASGEGVGGLIEPWTGHSYASQGTYHVRVFLLDSETGESAVGTTIATASDLLVSTIPPPDSTSAPYVPPPYLAAVGQPVPDVAVLQVSGIDRSSKLVAAIDWGDGSAPTAGTLVPIDPGGSDSVSSYLVSGSHAYALPGSYPTKVTILNADLGDSAVGSPTFSIGPEAIYVPSAPIPTIGGTAGVATGTIPLGSFEDADVDPSQAYAITIDWGDGSAPTPGSAAPQSGSAGARPDFVVSGDHTYARPGNYTITTSIAGSLGGQATLTTLASIVAAPAPPSALTSAPGPVADLRRGVASSIDLGTLSAVDPKLKAGQIAAYADFGDGSKTVRAQVRKTGAGTFAIVARHAYKAAGNYPIRVSATTRAGLSTSFASEVVVS